MKSIKKSVVGFICGGKGKGLGLMIRERRLSEDELPLDVLREVLVESDLVFGGEEQERPPWGVGPQVVGECIGVVVTDLLQSLCFPFFL